MIEIAELNGNWYMKTGSNRIQYSDKNSLIKAVAGIVGVSILTSDEVKKSPNPENVKVEIEISLAERIREKTKLLPHDYSCIEFDVAIHEAKNRSKNKTLPQLESTTGDSLESTKPADWDTETVTHDGIQFNKHFIELKLKVQSLETEILKLKQK